MKDWYIEESRLYFNDNIRFGLTAERLGQIIREIPESEQLDIQDIDFAHCVSLTTLPKEIGLLTSLKKLDFSRCQTLSTGSRLTTLPKEIGLLTSLKEINLFGCRLVTTLPAEIGLLTSLEQLNLGYCSSLTSLPEEIGALISLKEFNLSSCVSLTSFPDGMGSLTSLETLVLFGCRSLTSLPEEIGSLTSLQVLELYGCSSLPSIPAEIVNCSYINIHENNGCTALFNTLPEEFVKNPNFQPQDTHTPPSLFTNALVETKQLRNFSELIDDLQATIQRVKEPPECYSCKKKDIFALKAAPFAQPVFFHNVLTKAPIQTVHRVYHYVVDLEAIKPTVEVTVSAHLCQSCYKTHIGPY